MSAAFSWALNARLSDWGAFDILEMVTHILSWLGLALLFVVYPNTKPAPLLRISAALLLLPCIARLEAHLVLPHSMLGGTATAVLGAVAETSAAVACAMVIGHGCCIVPPRGAAGAGAAAPFLQQRRRHVPRQHATAQDPLITAATGSPSPSHYGSEYMLPSTPAYLFSWHSLCVCVCVWHRMSAPTHGRVATAEEQAPCLAWYSFAWLDSLFHLGHQRQLQFDDLDELSQYVEWLVLAPACPLTPQTAVSPPLQG